ncbi:MAG: succinate dehydrogenase assembly factor 2 [Hyphomicrobiaceae bacterium]
MSIDLESRKRRAAYRAAHRGTREMDWLIGKYAKQVLPDMQEAELQRFEMLLAMPDPELQKLIMAPTMPEGTEFGDLIKVLREFHNVEQGR